MKKMLNNLWTRLSVVNAMNWCALMVAVYTINIACATIHHQPVVPEEAKKLRKF